MLRAVRFASRFDLRIDDATADAIKRHAAYLVRISPERIAEEMRLMLTPPSRGNAWRLLWDLGLVRVIFRDLSTNEGAPLKEGRSLVAALAPRDNVRSGLALATAVLCYRRHQSGGTHGINVYLAADEVRTTVRAMRKLLRISNDEADDVEGTLFGLRPLLEGHPTVAQLKRFLQRDTAPLSIDLLHAMIAVNEYRERGDWLLSRFANLTDCNPAPFLTGDDLTSRGLKPGPAFKRALDFVYDEQLEGRVTTREQALELGERKVREYEETKRDR
jgi:tRNA nucleotidyltransferase/poly(A) polymerase